MRHVSVSFMFKIKDKLSPKIQDLNGIQCKMELSIHK